MRGSKGEHGISGRDDPFLCLMRCSSFTLGFTKVPSIPSLEGETDVSPRLWQEK
jgi:hypothetical protein